MAPDPLRVAQLRRTSGALAGLLVAAIITTPAPRGWAATLFTPTASVPTRAGLQGFTTVDLDRDGSLDLVVVSKDTISTFLGHGDGTFAARSALPVPGVTTLAIADLNADGIPDVVTTSPAGYVQDIFVSLGNGDGTLRAVSNSYYVDIYPHALAVGDMNGDGRSDVVVGGTDDLHGRGTYVVLFGNGDGTLTWATYRQYGNTGTPFAISLADLNGDGHLDIVAWVPNVAGVTVMLGNGDGNFGTAVVLPTASGTTGITVADVDGDCRPDIVVGCTSAVSVLLGHGDGTFDPYTTQPLDGTPHAVAIGDVNGDGPRDLVATILDANKATVLLGQGNGAFGTRFDYATGAGPQAISLADVNTDGRIDLAVANTRGDSISVLLYSAGGGDPPPVLPCNATPEIVPLGSFVVDVDSTLRFTVVATDRDGDSLTYGALSLPPGAQFASRVFTWTPALGQAGHHDVVFTATDPSGAADSQSVTIIVPSTHAPVLQAIGNITVYLQVGIVLTLSASDLDGDPITYSVYPLPIGASLVSQTFTWRPTSHQLGSYLVTFTATDSTGMTDSETLTITVAFEPSTNLPPVLDVIAPQTVVEGTVLSIPVLARDANGDSLSYSASPLPAGAVFAPQHLVWQPSVGQAGEYTVVFTAADPYGRSDSEAVLITVEPDPSAPSRIDLGATVVAGVAAIHLRLQRSTQVELDVFNAAGVRVGHVATDYPPGARDLMLALADARGRPLSTGVYVLRLTAGATIATRRVVVVR